MKFLILLLTFFLFVNFAQAEDKLKIHCQYYAQTQLQAEIGVVSMAKSISKDAEQVSLSSEEFKDENGKSFWVARFIIKVTAEEIQIKQHNLD